MRFKVGDKVLCKKNYINEGDLYVVFHEGSYYNIIKNTDDMKGNITSVCIETEIEFRWFNIEGYKRFDKYFYTKEELRKLKLNKINEI